MTNTCPEMIQGAPVGYASFERIFDEEGNPVDFQLLHSNVLFDKICGISSSNSQGLSINQIFPGEIQLRGGAENAFDALTALLEGATEAATLKMNNRSYQLLASTTDSTMATMFVTDITASLSESQQYFSFLTQSVIELSQCKSIDDIYAYAAEKISQLLNRETMIALVEYNHDLDIWKIKHSKGIQANLVKVTDLLGFNLESYEGQISTKYYDSIVKGKLTEIAFDFPGLFNHKLSDMVGKSVKKLLGIEKLYCLGFKQGGSLFGNITFTTNKNTPVVQTNLIEAFIAQASNFINRLKVEEENYRIDKQYKTYVNNAPLGIFVVDQNGNYLEVNDEACRITGFDSKELLQMNIMDLVDSDYTVAATNHFAKVVNDGRADDEILGITKSGTKRWWHVIASKINEERFLGFHTDITDRKELSKALLISQSNLQAIVENTFDSIWSINKNYVITYTNEVFANAFKATFGVEIKAGSNLLASLPVQIQTVWKERYDRVLSGERIVFDDIVEAPGVKIFIEVAANPIYRGGSVIGASLFGRDLTAKRLAEAEVLNQKQMLEKILQTSMDGFWIVNLNGEIEDVNESYCLMSGYSEHELLSMKISDLDVLETTTETRERIQRILDKGSELFQTQHKRKDGSTLDVEISVNFLDQGSGKMFCFLRDISQRKQIEAAKQELIERFQLIGSNLKGMIYQYCQMPDGTSYFPYASSGIENIYGCTPEEVKEDASKVFEVIHPDDMELVRNSITVSAESLLPWHAIYRVNLPSKKTMWVEGSSTPQKMANGSILWHGYIHDITERKLAEDLVQQNEKHLQHLLDLHRLTESSEDKVLDYTLEASLTVTHSQIAFLGRVDEAANLLSFKSWSTDVMEDCKVTEKTFDLTISERGLLGESLRQRKAYYFNDYENVDERKSGLPEGHIPIKRFLSVPVFSGGKIVALGAVANKQTDYTDTDIRALSSLLHEMWNIIELKSKSDQIRVLSRAMDQSPVSIIITDPEGIIQYVNPKFTQVTGYASAEVLGKKPSILKSGMQSDEVYKELWSTITQGREWNGELRNIKKNGDMFWEAVSISPIVNNEGLTIQYIAIKEDITEKKITEEKLLEAYKISKLGTFELNLKEMVFEVSSDMSFIYGFSNNRNFEYAEWLSSVHPDDKEKIEKLLHDVLAQMKPEIDIEFRIIRKVDQQLRWVHSVGKLQYNQKGEALRIVGTSRDITDIKEYEQNLINAKEQAEESNRLKTAFLQNLSHEVRTPLNGIIGFSELINDPGLSSAERKRFSEIIIERGWQLTSIINDILTISAIETGQEKLFLDKTNIEQLVNNHLEVFKLEAQAKGLQLRSKIMMNPDAIEIYADKPKIGQILNNLFNNAIKFTQSGFIELGCFQKDDWIEFYVKDTGIGIEKEKQARIFERFAQADDSIRLNFGGTGLGLSICKGFAELMGGNIWVTSEPNLGSTFYFTIPLIKLNKSNLQPDSAEALPSSGENKVLVVEDDETNFMVIELMLKKFNMHILHAKNGIEAIEMVQKEAIDLIFMDIKLPEMDGFTAAMKIRKLKPDLPIVAQTAHAAPSEIRQYKSAFNEYITKPYTREKIKKQLLQFGLLKD